MNLPDCLAADSDWLKILLNIECIYYKGEDVSISRTVKYIIGNIQQVSMLAIYSIKARNI